MAVIGSAVGISLAQRAAAQGSPEASPAASQSRTVTDYIGREVEIPGTPQRVVTLSLPILEIALSVGIKPVGSASFATLGGFPAYLDGKTDGIELIGDTEYDYEKILSLQPDLAITDYFGEDDAVAIEIIEQICPIVAVGEFRENWREDSSQVAGFLNRSDAFAVVEAAYDERSESVRQALGPDRESTTVAILRIRADDMRILKTNSFAGTVLTDLGLRLPDITDSGTGIAEDFSLEQARIIDVDAVFLVHDSGDEAVANLQTVLSHPVFQSLKVVQDGRIYLVDQETWITLRGYGAAEAIFDDIVRYLVDGEPGMDIPTS